MNNEQHLPFQHKKNHPAMYCAGGCGKIIAYGNHKAPHYCLPCGADPVKNPPRVAKRSQMLQNLDKLEADTREGRMASEILTDLIALMKTREV